MKIIVFKDLLEQPWKNGLGTTRQIAIFPTDATLNNFIWRASVATVSELGSFSNFDNVTRSFTLLTGDKITLSIQNQTIELHSNGQPITFSGEVSTEIVHCSAPSLDFSVMTHNHYAKHSVVHADFTDGQIYQRKSPTTLFLALEPCRINQQALNTFDALLLSEEDGNCVTIQTQTKTAPILVTEIYEYCPTAKIFNTKTD